ncbi:endonuclease/exonuclease/phosphatase family protein [Planctomycetota bacterium]
MSRKIRRAGADHRAVIAHALVVLFACLSASPFVIAEGGGTEVEIRPGDRVEITGEDCARTWRGTVVVIDESRIVVRTRIGEGTVDVEFERNAVSVRCMGGAAEDPLEDSGSDRRGESQPRQLRVLTYNIHAGRGADGALNLRRIAAVITKLAPDLVSLQEVDRGTRRSGRVDQAAELGRLTGMRPLFGRAIDFDGGQYGVAILSRFPVMRTENHPLPGSPERERRTALVAHIGLGEDGRELVFAATHLDNRADATDRMAQTRELNKLLLAGQGGLVILAGDLNAVPGSVVMQPMLSRWGDAAHDRPESTYPAGLPTRRIDYVLCHPPEGTRVLAAKVIEERVASDHRPLLTVLELVAASRQD